jgi:hypothetical protein
MMHTTLALLMALGHLAKAQESQFSYLPRATTSDDDLATITALSDGHLPTCFTNHPPFPRPTNGPGAKRDLTQDLNGAARIIPIDPISMTAGHGLDSLPTDTPEPVVKERDTPLVVVNKGYIPRPDEWAIPSTFTFTDTILNRTNTTATADGLTTPSSTESMVVSASATPHSDSYLKSHSKYFNRGDTYAKMLNMSALIDVMTHDAAPQPSGIPVAHTLLPTGDALLRSSNATYTTAIVATITGQSTALPCVASEAHSSSNASSSAHLTGTIGTLLSQAMFPGKMRGPEHASFAGLCSRDYQGTID